MGDAGRRPLAVVARDPATGAILGDALGRSSPGLLFPEPFPRPDGHRGLGFEIPSRFEAGGRRRGCVSAARSTISVQAPGFPERQGWTRSGAVPCLPEGTSRIVALKRLSEG